VQRWWTEHGLLECMCRLKEENQVSFVSRALPYCQNFHFLVPTTDTVLRLEGDDVGKAMAMAELVVMVRAEVVAMVPLIAKLTTKQPRWWLWRTQRGTLLKTTATLRCEVEA
jgi:hypothetical protein